MTGNIGTSSSISLHVSCMCFSLTMSLIWCSVHQNILKILLTVSSDKKRMKRTHLFSQ